MSVTPDLSCYSEQSVLREQSWRMFGLLIHPLGWVTWRSSGSFLEDHFYLHKGKVVHFSKIKRVTFRLTNIKAPTLRQVTRWIAQLGGFMGRKGDGEPGVTVLWLGFQRLYDIANSWLLFHLPSSEPRNVGKD